MNELNRPYYRTGEDENENEVIGQACATVNEGPRLTQQHFAQDADINVLVRRFGVEKVSSAVIDPAAFGDFSNAPDLRQALEIMRDAEEKFMHLPPKVRSRFQNSAAALWDFLQDPENGEEALALGLLVKRPEKGSQAVSASPVEPVVSPKGEPPKGADNA